MGTRSDAVPIERLNVSAYRIPTEAPESDGTLEWNSTMLVLVRCRAAGREGLGYTYGDRAVAELIRGKLAERVQGSDALSVGACWTTLVAAVRNLGRPGIASMAISAIDAALWDLKARLLDLPLVTLLDGVRDGTPVYGSGGFTSYTIEQLQGQLAEWVRSGIGSVKMKTGRHPDHDVERVRAAREAIGFDAQLFVDANGAYSRKQALDKAADFHGLGVSWFEEPVSSDDVEGLRLVRDRAPPGMEITTGEYGYHLPYFRTLLAAQAVDVLQADATRCGGVTGFLGVAALCDAHNLPLSSHTAPALHLHACCAARPVRHMEYFHDHVRIEHLLFDGVQPPRDGTLYPDRSRPGLGLEFKNADAQRYAV